MKKATHTSQRYLYFIFLLSLIVPNIMLCVTEEYSLLTVAATLLIPAGFYGVWLALTPRPGAMMFGALPFMVLDAFQMVLLYLFGNSVIAVDMFTNLYTTNISEAGELLGNLTPAIVGVCLLYIPMLILSSWSLWRGGEPASVPFRKRAFTWSVGAMIVGAGLGTISHRTGGDFAFKYTVFPANAIYNLKTSVDRWGMSNMYPETSKDFTFGATREPKAGQREIYVMVIGEASRAANWSLFGYERPTTPRLDTLSGVVPFYNTYTQNNATHKSVPIILSAASAENFSEMYVTKSFISAFRELGFRTVFISNQVPNRSFIDYFSEQADTLYRLRSGGAVTSVNHYDEEMLPIIDAEIERDTSNLLIVLHTYGSHFNFRERYPESDAVFLPDLAARIDAENRPAIINAYDNSVLYTDKFLSRIVERINLNGVCSAMLYCSDHGEDIMDDGGGRFLHASPTTTLYQLHVACLGWFSGEYGVVYPEKVAAAGENRDKAASTSSVFHTMLDIADIRADRFDASNSLVNGGYRANAQKYLSDHYEAVDNMETRR